MSQDKGKLIISIDGNTSPLEKQLRRLGKVGSEAIDALSVGFAAVGTAMSGVIAGAVGIGAEFEYQMSAVAAISGATASQMELLNEKAKEMGETTAFTATQAGQAFQYMAQAGWETEDMLSSIEGVMNLAAASGEDLALVSDIVTDAMTAFGLEAEESGRFADVLAKAAASSNTDVAKMGYTFKYVAPIAGSLGYAIEDVAVAVGLMANAGIKSDTAGTALRSTLTNMVNATPDAAAAMEKYGISLVDASGKIKPLNELLLELREAVKGMDSEGTERLAFAEAIAGKEAMTGLLAIVNASDEAFEKLTEEIRNSTGAAKEAAEIKLDNLTGQWQLFNSALQGVALTIYESIKEPLKESVEVGTAALQSLNSVLRTELVESLARAGEAAGAVFEALVNGAVAILPIIIKSFAALLDNIDSLVVAFSTFAGAVLAFKGATVITAFSTAVATAGGVSKALLATWTALNVAMRANPFVAVATVVGALIAALVSLYLTNDKVRLTMLIAWENIKIGMYKIIQPILHMIGEVVGAYNSLLNWIGAKPIKFDAELDELGEAEERVRQLRAELARLDGTTVGENVSLTKINKQLKEAKEQVDKLTDKDGEVSDNPTIAALKSQIAELKREIEELKKSVGSADGFQLSGISARIREQEDIGDSIDSLFSGLEGPSFEISGVGEALREQEELSSSIGSFFESVGEDSGDKFTESMVDSVQSGMDIVGDAFSSTLQAVMQGESVSVGDLMKELGKNLISSLANSMMNTATSVLDSAMDSIGKGLIKGFEILMGVSSPSKVFAEIGKWNMVGLAEGMQDNQATALSPLEQVKRRMANMFEDIDMEAVQGVFTASLVGTPALAAATPSNNIVNISVVTNNTAPNTEVETQVTKRSNDDYELKQTIISTATQDVVTGGALARAIDSRNSKRS